MGIQAAAGKDNLVGFLASLGAQATLTALDKRVAFEDAKDGMLGMRVARQLELPTTGPQTYTDISGRQTTVPQMDNTAITGNYVTSEGKQGNDAWGTRGRWCVLTGTIGGDTIGIGGVIFRTVQLFFVRDVQTGLVWATKILTDPFHDIKIYHKAPLALLRCELIDPEIGLHHWDEEDAEEMPRPS